MAKVDEISNLPLATEKKSMPHGDTSVLSTQHIEGEDSQTETLDNVVYTNDEEEPELHLPTWIALASIYLLLAGQGLAFQGPPAVVSRNCPEKLFFAMHYRLPVIPPKLSFIGADLGNTNVQTWIPNALALVQAVIGPVISSASDVFQVRKPIIIASCVIALVGSAIAPGATNIYRVIGAQALIGVGLSAVPLAYVVPSEILPRKWRPSKNDMPQARTSGTDCMD